MPVRDIGVIRKLIRADRRMPQQDQDQVLRLIAETGALLDGHFLLQGGAHSEHFLRFALLGRSPHAIGMISEQIERLLPPLARGTQVLCPESAGFFLGHAMAQRLAVQPAVSAIDSRRRPTILLRTGTLIPGKPALIVNDISTTGASLDPLLQLAQQKECSIVGVAVFAAWRMDFFHQWQTRNNLRGEALVAGMWETYSAGPGCPGCAQGRPLLPAMEFN
jgi:orotate phosphoribosyltransferase